MGIIARWVFKGLTMDKGSYNVSDGTIKHPPKGTGKGPKVRSKVVITKAQKKKK